MIKNYPNILLIVMDSVRNDHLSCYGYPVATTANIDVLATSGTLYQNAFTAANWTGASVSSILTGLYPSRHGYTNLRYYLDEDIITIPQLLADHGYRTIGISSNLYLSSQTGLARGFNEFYYNGNPETVRTGASLNQKSFLQQLYETAREIVPLKFRMMIKDLMDATNEVSALSRDDGALVNCKLAQRLLDQHDQSRPFFIYFHFQEPHSNYFPPRPFRKRFFAKKWPAEYRYLLFDHVGFFAGLTHYTTEDLHQYISLYDSAIAYTDFRIGELLDFLECRHVLDNTVVIITADHGDLFGENGYVWHSFNLYDPLIHVPLIIRYPDWFDKGEKNNQIVQTVDVLPTILDCLGINWPYSDQGQGQSIFSSQPRQFSISEAMNPAMMIERWLARDHRYQAKQFDQFKRDLRAIRSTLEKFIWSSDGKHAYYNLNEDPAETNNIFESNGCTTNLPQILADWLTSFESHTGGTGNAGFDKNTWERLKAMGYA